MKLSNRLISIAILSGLIARLTSASAEAGQENGGTTSRGGKASSHMSGKGNANTNAQWSADPEKGWVRAEERHKLQSERQSTDKSKKNISRQKNQNTKGGAGGGVLN